MPQKHEYFTYKFKELSEDAQAKAVEDVSSKLGGDWWDQGDIDDIGDVIRWTLAEQFGTPGADTYGVADYPGIPDVEMQGWDCDRAQSIDLKGTLTRDNAPDLPWVDGIEAVTLCPSRYGQRQIRAEVEYDSDVPQDLVEAIEQAVWEAKSQALVAGTAEIEYKSSEESARDWIEGNLPDFHENGNLA